MVLVADMLDFTKLQPPKDDAGVLIQPAAEAWLAAASANHEALHAASASLLGVPLSQWRRRTRQNITGRDDALTFVLGHQPELFHAGVWAKRAAAARAARAANGVAVNLVVDNDTPNMTALAVPSLDSGRVTLHHVAVPILRPTCPYEFTPRMSQNALAEFEGAVRRALPTRLDDSLFPTFVRGAAEVSDDGDWVAQVTGGLAGIDAALGVSLMQHRVSRQFFGPLPADMLLNARRFGECYNAALAAYRKAYRVRGGQRPIPDLHIAADRCEVPLWATRADRPRRRLFVARAGSLLVLCAGDAPIGEFPVDAVGDPDHWPALAGELNGWYLRPRALALTLWARLLLADLFIHGIGGAKYDRISDDLMSRYYGVAPPQMVCVSATLRLALPVRPVSPQDVRALRRSVRDLTYNPQHVASNDLNLQPLLTARAEAIAQSEALRRNDHKNRGARRTAYEDIRRLNHELVERCADEYERMTAELASMTARLAQRRVARGRDYFVGLHPRRSLEALMAALPSERSFRV